MNIFDGPILDILQKLSKESIVPLDAADSGLELADRNPFLMERDTAVELGGYPKESINIYVPSSNLESLLLKACESGISVNEPGVYCIGNPAIITEKEKLVSFGKIVLLKTKSIPDEKWYEFTQKELMTDTRLHIKDVMQRQSSTHYNLNLRIGKTAMKNGFSISRLGKTIKESFMKLEEVESAVVIFIVGESALYKDLLGNGEKIKEITLTLNHIFDGIDMDCGHCNLVEICNEVEGIRKLHKKKESKS